MNRFHGEKILIHLQQVDSTYDDTHNHAWYTCVENAPRTPTWVELDNDARSPWVDDGTHSPWVEDDGTRSPWVDDNDFLHILRSRVHEEIHNPKALARSLHNPIWMARTVVRHQP